MRAYFDDWYQFTRPPEGGTTNFGDYELFKLLASFIEVLMEEVRGHQLFSRVVNAGTEFSNDRTGAIAWSLLTERQQCAMITKLGDLRVTVLEAGREVFNRIFTGKTTEETLALVAAAKNLIDNAGGRSDSEVWAQIEAIQSAWLGKHSSASIEFRVRDKKIFLTVLRRHGFEVDSLYEKLNIRSYHRHSARFITQTSQEPGMHFVQQKNYPETRFDVHWDPRSVAFKAVAFRKWGRLLRVRPFIVIAKAAERLAAGLSHSEPKSALETREALRRAGLALGET